MSNVTADPFAVCSTINGAFLGNLIVAGISLAISTIVRWYTSHPVTPGVVSLGIPSSVIVLFCEIAFWLTVPVVVLFLIFRVITDGDTIVREGGAFGCINGAQNLPIFPMFMLFNAAVFFFTSNGQDSREKIVGALFAEMRKSIFFATAGNDNNNNNSSSSASNGAVVSPASAEDTEADTNHSVQQQPQQQQRSRDNGSGIDMQPATKAVSKRILVIGAASRGAVFSDLVNQVAELRNGADDVQMVNLDFSGSKQAITTNLCTIRGSGNITEDEARAMVVGPDELTAADMAQFYAREQEHVDVIKIAGTPIHGKALADGQHYTEATNLLEVNVGATPSFFDTARLGLKPESFDAIIVLPFVRTQKWIGGFLSSEGKKALRCVDMLRATSNVLKPGGTITCLDGFGFAVFLQQDVKQTRVYAPETVQFRELDVEVGSAFFKQKLCLITAVKKASGADVATSATRFSLSGHNFESMQEAEGAFWSANAKWAAMFFMQTAVFFALMFGAAGMWGATDWPDAVPSTNRFNSIFSGIATGYVFIAYIARTEISENVPVLDAGSIVLASVKGDVVVIIVALVFTTIFFLPTFFIQLALHATSLSTELRGIIGIIISIFIGLQMYKFNKRKNTEKDLRARGVSEEHITQIMAKT